MSPTKLCDSCKTAPSAAFCRADSAFLCLTCDAEIHAAGELASRHPRVWLCEVCEHAPAAVTCRADAAVLCTACDRDIHSVNPLSRRHERLPVAPFYDTRHSAEEEAEAASWLLLPNPDGEDSEYKSPECMFSHVDPYLDLDLTTGEQKPADGVVPVSELGSGHYPGPVVDGFPTREMSIPGSKPFMYNFTSQSISQSVSSSSPDVGVVPDYYPAADASGGAVPVLGLDRKARVLRYREKRKNRKFEKTIRYASRKAYAETRPRIKGRFAKRSELEVEAMIGVVPSF